jgi:hypothetical protein
MGASLKGTMRKKINNRDFYGISDAERLIKRIKIENYLFNKYLNRIKKRL